MYPSSGQQAGGSLLDYYNANRGQPAYNPSSGPGNTTMGAYQKQLDTAPANFNDIYSQLGSQVGKSVYQDPNFSGAVGTLQNFSQTGGYSPADIASIRERATSPIRSIYANAQADINRQRNLQGGYSPNYTAATAKMARDMSSQISDVTGNVNAQLAQNIIGNRMNATNTLTGATQGAATGDLTRAIQALQSMSSLYGTRPGLLSTLGDQTLEAQRLSDQQQQFFDSLRQQGQLGELQGLIRGL